MYVLLGSGNLVDLVQLIGLWSGRFFIGRLAAGEECFTVTSRRRWALLTSGERQKEGPLTPFSQLSST